MEKECPMRTGLGNCIAGSLCTSVPSEVCEGLRGAYGAGYRRGCIRGCVYGWKECVKAAETLLSPENSKFSGEIPMDGKSDS